MLVPTLKKKRLTFADITVYVLTGTCAVGAVFCVLSDLGCF